MERGEKLLISKTILSTTNIIMAEACKVPCDPPLSALRGRPRVVTRQASPESSQMLPSSFSELRLLPRGLPLSSSRVSAASTPVDLNTYTRLGNILPSLSGTPKTIALMSFSLPCLSRNKNIHVLPGRKRERQRKDVYLSQVFCHVTDIFRLQCKK